MNYTDLSSIVINLLLKGIAMLEESGKKKLFRPVVVGRNTAPPPDHEEFLALRRWGFKAVKRNLEKRRRNKDGTGSEPTK